MGSYLSGKQRCPLSFLILIGVLATFHTQSLQAESNDSRRTTEPAPSIRQPIFRQLERAQGLIQEDKFQQAHALLNRLRAEKSLSSYEAAQSWHLTAYAYYLQERYRDAIAAYSQILEQERIPRAITESTLKTLSQLYFTVEEYRRAIEYAQRLANSAKAPSPENYLLLGQAYFHLGEYRNALKPMEAAVSQYRESGEKPKESWLLLLRVIYYELKRYDNLLSVLRELVRLYPKAQYLITIADVHGELDDTRKQLALMEALYEGDHLKSKHELLNLANLYLLHGIPYKAAKLLEKEMKAKRVEVNVRNLKLLSQMWYAAREINKSILPLQRAAERSNSGELYLRLAQAYMDLERWTEATTAIERGLVTKDIDRPDKAQLMLGTAFYNQDKLPQAKSAFEQALTDERSEEIAKQWLVFIETEIHRRRDAQETKLPSEPAGRSARPTDS